MRKINRIQRIKIENIKGKDLYELRFNELHANFPNLFVAPNGFGKSTIAVSFKALRPNKIELDKEDFFEGDENNLPSLELELVLDSIGNTTLVADSSKNDISTLIDTYVIKSPVYAKSTSRSFGRFSSQSARLDVEDLVFYEKIPQKIEIGYKLKDIKDKYGEKGKLFLNISDIFKSLKNLELLCNNLEVINKCSTQIRPQTAINNFIQQVTDIGSAKVIKDKITSDNIKIIKDNPLLSNLLHVVNDLENLPFDIDSEVDLIFTVIQIVEVIKKVGSDIKKVKTYLEYVEYRRDIDYKLDTFNTTGRTIKTKETKKIS